MNNKHNQKPKPKKQQLEELRLKWNMQSKEAIADRASFILNKARLDYLRVYGTSGVGLARYQAQVLQDDAGIGTHREVQRKERARAKKLILDTFKEFPRDTVTGMIAADMVDELAGTDTSLTADDLDTPGNLHLIDTKVPSPGSKTDAPGVTGDKIDVADPAFPFPLIPGTKWRSKGGVTLAVTVGLLSATGLAPADALTPIDRAMAGQKTEVVNTQHFMNTSGAPTEAARGGIYMPVLFWPVDRSAPISSGFGYREAPCSGCSTNHQGVDMNPGYGSEIYAASLGTVTQVGWNGSLGWSVTIADGYSWEFVYAHMIAGSSTVNVGDEVVAGQVIGQVGCTGSCTGAHLHLELHEFGEKIDPLPILNRYAIN